MSINTKRYALLDANGIVADVFVSTNPHYAEKEHIVESDVAEIGQKWNEQSGKWVLDAEVFTAEVQNALKERRDMAVESSTVEIGNGAIFLCDKGTQDAVVKTFTGMQAAGMAEYPDWKAENGYYDLTIAQMQEAGVAIMIKVSEGFTAEKATLTQHTQTPFTTIEDAIAYFDNIFDGE